LICGCQRIANNQVNLSIGKIKVQTTCGGGRIASNQGNLSIR
jgi:hypothetical protein